MRGSSNCWLTVLAAACCVFVAGCGGSSVDTISVTGRLLDGGQAASLDDYEEYYSYYEVEFYPLDASGNLAEGKSIATEVDQAGNFQIDMLAAGKYRVAVHRMGESDDGGTDDIWRGKYDAEKSPFEVEVTDGGQVTIDLADAGDGA